MDKVKIKAALINGHTKSILKNASHLVESVSLLIVAFYNYTTAYHAHLSSFELKVRVAASLVIGLRGAHEFLRYLRDK